MILRAAASVTGHKDAQWGLQGTWGGIESDSDRRGQLLREPPLVHSPI